ncbi:transporter substrate-binding domain-containing protein [Alteromonas sp. 5E99-2]|uniref:transporter substrate-binding domain-containing protein n=1 Tax=Alteromonas sp. 5E99-2 TaxID=2817683 RepID=UPI001A99EE1A|nr:transporter substrate-binding domain-containing protein [Alteromonas sp. 5E99-2]MBO1256039.1 transporter substrate-binding domain-containing protein [Alteromonas sp. 5E99-2]
MRYFITFCIYSILFIFPSFTYSAVWTIHYPKALTDDDKRNEYPLAVLTLALDKTGVRYKLIPSDKTLNQGKAVRQLKENRDINVFWGMTDKEREDGLLPIRIPYDKGLIGWRVLLTREEDEQNFDRLTSLRSLLRYTAVQGKDWPDTKILQSNGFNVKTTDGFNGAYKALRKGEGDFFPRSVIEVTAELKSLGNDSALRLDDKLVLQYPAASYFFVNKSNLTLAKLIDIGLRRAIESGEFDNLFNNYFGGVITDLGLAERQIFRLSNPIMPKESPINNASLWFEIEPK